jgi:glutamate formiminotransferase
VVHQPASCWPPNGRREKVSSDAADTEIENVMVATSVDGRMLVVSFNVTQELAGEWLSVGKEIIKSIKAND